MLRYFERFLAEPPELTFDLRWATLQPTDFPNLRIKGGIKGKGRPAPSGEEDVTAAVSGTPAV